MLEQKLLYNHILIWHNTYVEKHRILQFKPSFLLQSIGIRTLLLKEPYFLNYITQPLSMGYTEKCQEPSLIQ